VRSQLVSVFVVFIVAFFCCHGVLSFDCFLIGEGYEVFKNDKVDCFRRVGCANSSAGY